MEPEFQERGQEEMTVWLIDQMDTKLKTEIDAIDETLLRINRGQCGYGGYGRGDIGEGRSQTLPAAKSVATCVQARTAGGA